MPKKKADFKPYRPRKKVVEELKEKGEITEIEAQQLTYAVDIADKAKYRGKYFIDLRLDKYEEAQKQELAEGIQKGKLTPNQKKMLHTLRVLKNEKPLLSNSLSIANAISNYFQLTLEDGNKPTMNGLALAIGISKKDMQSLLEGNKVYINGVELKGKDAIEEAVQVIATMNEIDIAESGGMGAMFLGKNNFGLTDKTDVNVHHDSENVDEDELDKKYKDIPIIDID